MTAPAGSVAPRARWSLAATLLGPPALLAGSLLLASYRVPRVASLGPTRPNGWEASSAHAALLLAVAGLWLCTGAMAGGRRVAIVRMALGLLAVAVVCDALLDLPLVLGRHVAGTSAPSVRATSSALGPALAMVAAGGMFAIGLLGWPRRRWSRTTAGCVAAVFALSLLSMSSADRIPDNNGWGFDGIVYARLAQDFTGIVFAHHSITHLASNSGGVDSYYVQKTLPSALVYAADGVVGARRSPANVVQGFELLNVALLTLAAWLWCLLADRLGLRTRGKVVGIVAGFASFLALKSSSYYPVTTDTAGYAVGLAFAYLYVARRTWLLALAALLGAFTYPTALWVGALLLALPPPAVRAPSGASGQHQARRFISLARLLVPLAVVVVYVLRYRDLTVSHYALATGVTPTAGSLRWLSVAVASAYLFGGLFSAVSAARPVLGAALRSLISLRVFGVIGFAVAAHQLQLLVAHGETADQGAVIASQIPWESAVRPGVFIVAHAVYFGPIFVLAMLCWPSVCRELAGRGPALLAVGAVLVCASIGSESRQIAGMFAVVLPFAVRALEPDSWRWWQVGAFAAASLAFSKFWLRIGLVDPLHPQAFPNQRYYLSQGPWISPSMYLAQGLCVVLAGALAFAIWRASARRRRRVRHRAGGSRSLMA